MDILFAFGILPIYMYIVKAHLLLVSAALRSKSALLKNCAGWNRN